MKNNNFKFNLLFVLASILFLTSGYAQTVTIEKKPTEANLLLKQIHNKKTKVLFHGIGSEPFWDLYITENEVLYSVNEQNTSFILLTPFDKKIKTQKISYKSIDGQIFKVTIIKEPAGDGMSESTYPYTVVFSKTELYLNGAGDSKLLHQ